jgi:hypothetical protein
MLINRVTYDVFDYTNNNIEFSILFDIETKPYFNLTIIKKKSDLFLTFDIENGYIIETNISKDKYNLLKRMLEINPPTSNPFSTFNFFQDINSKIPSCISRKPLSKHTIARIYSVEEPDLVYIKTLINWQAHPQSGRHCSPENKEKTKKLYRELYEQIKDKDISVKYTDQNIMAEDEAITRYLK